MRPERKAVRDILQAICQLERAGVASDKIRVVMTTPLFERIRSDVIGLSVSPLDVTLGGCAVVVFNDPTELWYVAADWGTVEEEDVLSDFCDFRVGDEVRYVDSDTTFVVCAVDSDGYLNGFNARGDMFSDKSPLCWVKTGRHFPEMADLLAKIGGTS